MDIVPGRIRRPLTNLRRLGAVVCLVVFAAGCSAPDDTIQLFASDFAPTLPEAVPTTPPIPLPTVTPLPTSQPTAVPTALPTPVPTAAVVALPDPTATLAPAATATAEPTALPQATAVPEQPVLAEPTASPEATAVPEAAGATEPAVALSSAQGAPPESDSGERRVTSLGYQPLGVADGVALALPVARIELIGFHEAGHPGAKGVNAAATGVAMITLDSRSRDTPARSAADIVVPPGEPVVAPATGTVIAANQYILYCEHDDQLVYIEPDGLPGWQVRVFHVEGPGPAVGTRVIAGETPIADSARQLPFESQVDKFTGEPSWPHVHVEVVDTSVPDTRPPGPGCP